MTNTAVAIGKHIQRPTATVRISQLSLNYGGKNRRVVTFRASQQGKRNDHEDEE